MDQDRINDREWGSAGNWHGGILGIYASEADSRILVPKRSRWMGWTLNFAHPVSRLIVGLGIAAALWAVLRDARR